MAKKRKCATPKCRGNVRADNKFCWSCEKRVRRDMAAGGYLQDLTWVKEEEHRRKAAMMSGAGQANKNRQSRIHADVVVARQVCGEMMVSKKGKK